MLIIHKWFKWYKHISSTVECKKVNQYYILHLITSVSLINFNESSSSFSTVSLCKSISALTVSISACCCRSCSSVTSSGGRVSKYSLFWAQDSSNGSFTESNSLTVSAIGSRPESLGKQADLYKIEDKEWMLVLKKEFGHMTRCLCLFEHGKRGLGWTQIHNK